MDHIYTSFMAGGVAALAAVAALLFLRFYRRTRDPLFLLFSISFFLQGAGRVMILLLKPRGISGTMQEPDDLAPFYLLRLAAYGLIIFAIFQKNRTRAPGLRTPPTPPSEK